MVGCSVWEYILKMSTRLTCGLVVEFKGRRRSNNDSKVFSLSNWVDGDDIHKGERKLSCVRKEKKSNVQC